MEGTQKRVRMIRGKRAIGVRAIEVLLYIILTPLNALTADFYIVKLGFTEVYIIFLISTQNT